LKLKVTFRKELLENIALDNIKRAAWSMLYSTS